MSEQLITVTFLTNTLYIVRHLDQPFVPMKPVVEAIGLAWQVQHRKLTAEQRYNHVVIPLHSPGGLQDTLCIPLRKLNGWLFSINASKVKPDLIVVHIIGSPRIMRSRRITISVMAKA